MNPNSILLLTAAVIALILCYVLLKDVHYTGKTFGYTRKLGSRHQKQIDKAELTHKRVVLKFLLSLLVPVACIETVVYLEGGRWGNPTLFLWHEVFIGLFLFNLTLQGTYFNGLKNKRVHILLFKSLVIFTLVMAGTGSWLIVQLFDK